MAKIFGKIFLQLRLSKNECKDENFDAKLCALMLRKRSSCLFVYKLIKEFSD
jgi:hypothetical protein